MTVEGLISELLKCNPYHKVSFCNVEELSKAETNEEDGEVWITIFGNIEVVNRHENGVVLGFEEK